MTTAYQRAVTYFRTGGYAVKEARKAARAWLAACERASAYGLRVSWEDEEIPWEDQLDERPPIWTSAVIWDTGEYRAGSRCLAQLGGIGLLTWSDGYVREVEAELLTEACDLLDAEADRLATSQANELASRATFAAGGQ